MYYPYLRGRQFELIALREYASQRGDRNNIVPIIEPVKDTFNSMKLALPKLIEGGVKFALILNPQVGDIKKTHEITEALKDELVDLSKWIPAYIIANNYAEVLGQIEESGFNKVMVICTDITNTSDNGFENLILSPMIKYIVSKENRTLKRKLSSKGKELIRLDDNFNAQKSNKNYSIVEDERFSEEHLFYKEDGYAGFSDYTVLVSEYIEGGFLPWAVAIHLTYQKENEEVWIKHFVSISNGDRANIQGKFAEAAEKAVAFLDIKNIHTYASEELRSYYNNGIYPGLGMVKKISIKNHLELLNGILN
jgi:hypothetical protein